ncbi:MAG: alpha/beta hydrolase [Pseudonocardia sp.]
MRRTWVTAAAAIVAVGLAAPVGAAAAADGVVDVPVEFTVRNVNESKVPCEADGAQYVVRGSLVAPASALTGDGALMLYLHGLSYTGDTFFHLRDVPGHDHATKMAEAGHASLVFDLPGYGASDTVPDGAKLCYGSEATIIHQMIGQLRSGGYTAKGRDAVAFDRIGLTGHSAGGFTAQAVAYSFPEDLDALMIFAFADQGLTPTTLMETRKTGSICAAGGEPKIGEPETTGYAYFGQTDADFRAAHFHAPDAQAQPLAVERRPKDPCGRAGSAPPNIATDTALLGTVDQPVLLVYGEEDAIFDSGPAGTRAQKMRYAGTDDVTDVFLPGTGHALTLERSAPQLRATVSGWLGDRGF